MPSQRYAQLKARITELRNHLLPSQFSDVGEYTEEVRDKARGFRMLVHAEIEAYIEDRAREILLSALRKWKAKKESGHVLLSLAICWTKGWSSGRQPTNKTQIEDINSGIQQAAKEYFSNINRNHGIKEENIRLLLLPIGIDIGELDASWLASMSSFGGNRGIVTHSSVSSTLEIDPANELKTVEQLLTGIEALDEKLDKIAV